MKRKKIFDESINSTRLMVWENKKSLYAKLLHGNEIVSSASFYDKDGDMDLYRVKEYFNFF